MSDIVSDFVEVIVFRRQGRRTSFLLLKRSQNERPYPGIWQVVSGKRKRSEKPAVAALREVREETGISPVRMWVLPFVNSFYAHMGDAVHMVPTFAAEIPVSSEVVLSHEHDEWVWVSRKEAEPLIQWPAHATMMDLVRTYVLHPRGAALRIPITR